MERVKHAINGLGSFLKYAAPVLGGASVAVGILGGGIAGFYAPMVAEKYLGPNLGEDKPEIALTGAFIGALGGGVAGGIDYLALRKFSEVLENL